MMSNVISNHLQLNLHKVQAIYTDVYLHLALKNLMNYFVLQKTITTFVDQMV